MTVSGAERPPPLPFPQAVLRGRLGAPELGYGSGALASLRCAWFAVGREGTAGFQISSLDFAGAGQINGRHIRIEGPAGFHVDVRQRRR